MPNLIGSLLSIIFNIILVNMLLELEDKPKKNLYLMGLFVTVVLICDGLVWHALGYQGFMKLYPLIINIPLFIAFLFVSKYKGIKLLFVVLTASFLCTLPISIGLILLSHWVTNRNALSVVSILMDVPTGFIVYRYFRPSFLYMLRNTDKGWFGFCTIPLSFYALIYFTGMSNVNILRAKSALLTMGLALILTVAAYVMILRVFKQTIEQITMQNEQNLFQMQVAAAQVHLEALQESQEKTIIYRHDMRHHLNLIAAYLADNNKAAAQKYITGVEKAIESATVETYCNNYTVNLILSSYILRAKNEQITVETQINLPGKNAVSDMDLCVIFANTLENAVNACKPIRSANDRALKIVCKTKSDKLFIQITNSYEGSVIFVADMPVSSEENHGLGTKSIAAVAQKYGGVCSFTAEDGVFKTSIIL